MISLWLSLALAAPFGWRAGGDAVVEASPPAAWGVNAEPVWSVETENWSNASVVPFGANVCVMEEPTTVACFDRATGARAWSATNTWVDTLTGTARAEGEALVARAAELETAVQAAQAEVSTLRRELRRAAGDPAVVTKLQEASQAFDEKKAELASIRTYLTPPDLDMIGYTSATPFTDGKRLFVLSGQGVVSAFDPIGKRLWARWVGNPPRPMVGYDFGSAASPQLADGVLLVAHHRLQGLDPATGEVRWSGPLWAHYGTPAVMNVGGMDVAFSPDGVAYRVKDGAKLAEGLGDIWYTGPVVKDDVVYWVGSYGEGGRPGNAHGTAVRVRPDGAGGIQTEQLWKGPLPLSQRIYAAPLVDEGRIYAITKTGDLMVVDAATGAERGRLALEEAFLGDTYQSVTRVGDRILVGGDMGRFAFVTRGDAPELLEVHKVPGRTRAQPYVEPGVIWARSLKKLVRYGAP